MHAFLHGLIPCDQNNISSFTRCEKHHYNLLVDEMLVPIWSGERSKYPRTNFLHGISNLKLLTANEWGGVALVMALIVCSKKGYILFQKIYNGNTRKGNQHRLMYVTMKIVQLSLRMKIARCVEEDDSTECGSHNEAAEDSNRGSDVNSNFA